MRFARIILGFLFLSMGIIAQPAGTFVSTGSTFVSPGGYTATLLRDGRVLFAGVGTFPATASVEIFDPSAGTLTPTGSMNQIRYGPTATLLTDGRVLIAGGATSPQGSFRLTSAEIYDPDKGTFELTGNLPAGYSVAMAAALLNDGRVLFVGNDWMSGTYKYLLDPSAIYDPAQGTFSSTEAIPLLYPVATPLTDGRVLFVGEAGDESENLAFIYDPASGAFNPTGSQAPYSIFPQDPPFAGEINRTTFLFSTALLANGSVLLVGGADLDYSDQQADRNTAEIYDPSTGAFHVTGTMPEALESPVVTTLPGGHVLIGGGKSVALYDPTSGVFSALSSPASWDTATLLLDGTVLLTEAGQIGVPNPSRALWLYVPAPSAVSSASLAAPLAPESLGSIFGARLASAPAAAADTQSPPTSLGGISVNVRDSTGTSRLAPLLYVSPSQINFEVPAGVVPGSVAVDVLNGSTLSSVTAQVKPIAPGIFTIPGNIAAAYGTRIEPDGSQTELPAGAPIMLDERPVYLSLFGTGLRGLSSLANVTVMIGGLDAQVAYAGPQGAIPGLDQVNVLLPASLKGAGEVPIQLTVDGTAANQVVLNII